MKYLSIGCRATAPQAQPVSSKFVQAYLNAVLLASQLEHCRVLSFADILFSFQGPNGSYPSGKCFLPAGVFCHRRSGDVIYLTINRHPLQLPLSRKIVSIYCRICSHRLAGRTREKCSVVTPKRYLTSLCCEVEFSTHLFSAEVLEYFLTFHG